MTLEIQFKFARSPLFDILQTQLLVMLRYVLARMLPEPSMGDHHHPLVGQPLLFTPLHGALQYQFHQVRMSGLS